MPYSRNNGLAKSGPRSHDLPPIPMAQHSVQVLDLLAVFLLEEGGSFLRPYIFLSSPSSYSKYLDNPTHKKSSTWTTTTT